MWLRYAPREPQFARPEGWKPGDRLIRKRAENIRHIWADKRDERASGHLHNYIRSRSSCRCAAYWARSRLPTTTLTALSCRLLEWTVCTTCPISFSRRKCIGAWNVSLVASIQCGWYGDGWVERAVWKKQSLFPGGVWWVKISRNWGLVAKTRARHPRFSIILACKRWWGRLIMTLNQPKVPLESFQRKWTPELFRYLNLHAISVVSSGRRCRIEANEAGNFNGRWKAAK